MMTRTRHLRGDKTARKVQLSRKPLPEQVADALRQRIITGDLAPGQRLALADLAVEIGVSLTPLREAVKLLASENLIESTPNRGARVAPVTVDSTRELFEVMAGLEALAAELAARRMSDDDLTSLEGLHDEMRGHVADVSPNIYFALNSEIHDRIVEGARNPLLSAHRARLAQQAERARFIALGNDSRREDAMREHDEVMAALRARDPDLARRTWRRHLIASGEETARLLRLQQRG